jgi:hypothetical protein
MGNLFTRQTLSLDPAKQEPTSAWCLIGARPLRWRARTETRGATLESLTVRPKRTGLGNRSTPVQAPHVSRRSSDLAAA